MSYTVVGVYLTVIVYLGGGVVFGPRPRSFYYPLSIQVRRLGLVSTLSAKLAQGKLIIVDNIDLPTHKTKDFEQLRSKHNWNSALIIPGDEVPNNLKLATGSIPNIRAIASPGLNVYDCLRAEHLILTKQAVEYLQNKRLKTLIDDTEAKRILKA